MCAIAEVVNMVHGPCSFVASSASYVHWLPYWCKVVVFDGVDVYLTCLFKHVSSYIVEDKEVELQFVGDEKTYSILWTELLTPGMELPYSSYEDLQPNLEVLAPWEDGDGIIQFAPVTVLPSKTGTYITCLIGMTVHTCMTHKSTVVWHTGV